MLGSLYPRSLGPVYKSPLLSSAKRAKGKEGRVTSAHCIGENFLAVARSLYKVFQVHIIHHRLSIHMIAFSFDFGFPTQEGARFL